MMKTVIQRVINASVTVNGKITGAVGAGLLVYLGVAHDDTEADAGWLAEKIVNLRIFDDSEEKMNVSLADIVNHTPKEVNHSDIAEIQPENYSPAGVLAVSQFTLLGDARKGRRPSWGKAAPPERANELYLAFVGKIREQGIPCETGVFQAKMMVNYTNDGPVTILLDSKE